MAKAKMTQAKSKHRRTKPKPPAGSPPERFFEKDLPGEEAPSFETMQALFKHAGAIYTARPWNRLEEDELVVFKEPASGELCFCSVMGSGRIERRASLYWRSKLLLVQEIARW